jgi:hypothetical protein
VNNALPVSSQIILKRDKMETTDIATKFFAYVSDEPEGDWEYQLDSFGVVYGDGAWPFGRFGGGEADSIRLSPGPVGGAQYVSAAQTYVVIEREGDRFVGTIHYMVRREGLGGMVATGKVRGLIDGDNSSWSVSTNCPAAQDAFEDRARKVMEFILRSIQERDSGVFRPQTAQERFEFSEAK